MAVPNIVRICAHDAKAFLNTSWIPVRIRVTFTKVVRTLKYYNEPLVHAGLVLSYRAYFGIIK